MQIDSSRAVETYLDHVNQPIIQIPSRAELQENNNELVIKKAESSQVVLKDGEIKVSLWREFWFNLGRGGHGHII